MFCGEGEGRERKGISEQERSSERPAFWRARAEREKNARKNQENRRTPVSAAAWANPALTIVFPTPVLAPQMHTVGPDRGMASESASSGLHRAAVEKEQCGAAVLVAAAMGRRNGAAAAPAAPAAGAAALDAAARAARPRRTRCATRSPGAIGLARGFLGRIARGRVSEWGLEEVGQSRARATLGMLAN